MTTVLSLPRQVLAGIISAPVTLANKALYTLEKDDFEHWIDQLIFNTLNHVTFSEEPNPANIIEQTHRHLLNNGHYTDTDNGVRTVVLDLAGNWVEPLFLQHHLISYLIEERYRRAATQFAGTLAHHAGHSSLDDLNHVLAQLASGGELQRLYNRLQIVRGHHANT